jgi:CHAT domain-containing protein/Tfp pilus assembly protein PilF
MQDLSLALLGVMIMSLLFFISESGTISRGFTKIHLRLILWLCLFPMGFAAAITAPEAVSTSASPAQYVAQGFEAFQRGAFAQVIAQWTMAAQAYEKAGNADAQSKTLTYLAQAYQTIGQYREAGQSLERALVLAKKAENRTQVAAVLSGLGNVYIAIGPPEKAQQYFTESLGLAKALSDASLMASILNNLGNLFTSQQKYPDALGVYKESIALAEQTGQRSLAARALTNAAIASQQHTQYQEAKAFLDRALALLQGVSNSYDQRSGFISIGLAYDALRPHLPNAQDRLLVGAYEAFHKALRSAEVIGDLRTASYALGSLGKLYETEHRYPEALQLTRQAIFAAQQVQAPESLYRWQWQTGRLLKSLGNREEAIAAYRRAVDTLQAIRPEMAVRYGRSPDSFRDSVGSLYFELVDLLLQRAAALPDRRHAEPYLAEARDMVELLKAAELRDYFRDDCVDIAQAKVTKLDVISQTAAIVYPILLPDRTELLVSLPTGLKRFAVPVGADRIEQRVRVLRRGLQGLIRRYLAPAQELYDWLIRPLESDLVSFPIDTLVFVPDGPLRTIPMAALHDGEHFLIHKYAVAITPGLDLTDPRPIPRQNMQVLAAGLTEAVQEFPALPYVSTELQAIQQLYRAKILLNQDFLASTIEGSLKEEPFTIVHIASHGQFAAEAEQSFLLAFDEKLTMDRLDQMVGLLRFRDDPLELLTLSACETAVGDDQAALGLAGVAIKAGARSALATLWKVSDQATAILIAEFYRQLQDPAISRAIALQRAQLKLLDDPAYHHPAYWSPFLLINNWL